MNLPVTMIGSIAAAVFLITLPLYAELAPETIERMRAEAGEVVQIEIVAVEVAKTGAPKREVIYEAAVSGVDRTKAGLKPGGKIKIRSYYLVESDVKPLAKRNPTEEELAEHLAGLLERMGPQPPALLSKGWKGKAYLNASKAGGDFEIAVYGHSLEQVVTDNEQKGLGLHLGEKRAKGAPCVSATAIVEGCEIEGEITQVEFEPAHGRWAPLRAIIKIRNTSNDGRKISFFCQVISQDSKNHSDAFVFSEGTYEMAIAPRETIVREFPFIDLMASMPSGYMKDTVAIRIGRKLFKRYGDYIPIKPDQKIEVGDDPVTIAVRTEQRDQVKPIAPAAAGRKDLDAASKEIREFYAAQPDNGHREDVKLTVSEYQIGDLWEEMGMQLFRLDRGGLFSWNFLYADAQLKRLDVPTLGGAGLLEGAVHEKTLYLTSDWGSGILRTALYRTRRDKGGMIQTEELGVISSVGGRFDKKFLEDNTVSIPRYIHFVVLATTIVGVACVIGLTAGGIITLTLAFTLVGTPPALTYLGWFWLFGPEIRGDNS